MSRKVQIVLGANAMEVTAEPVASNVAELLEKGHINSVYAVKLQKKPSTADLKYITPSTPFTIGDTITGATSGATATVQSFIGTVGLNLVDVVGEFINGETLNYGMGDTATADSDMVKTYNDDEWLYPYPTMTVLVVHMDNDEKFDIELQDVTNQPTWSTGTLAGQTAAIAAINAWL